MSRCFRELMRALNLHPWQSTVLALLGCAAGLLLHLRWHPLRQHLSDAWDFVRSKPLLVVGTAGSLLLAETAGGDAPVPRTLEQLSDWREIVGPLAWEAAERLAVLPHQLMPSWPLACLLPLIVGMLTIRVWRRPYRYGVRRPGPEQHFSLLAAAILSIVWLVLEGLGVGRMLPEGMETAKLGLRQVFTALAAAGVQVWLILLVLAWERPGQTAAEKDATTALERAFAIWQRVACLGAFNLGWMVWRHCSQANPDLPALGWLWTEFLLLFSALPLAVAVVRGSFWDQGAVALQLVVFRGLIALVLLGITALAILILAHYGAATGRALCMDAPLLRLIVLPLNALGLAMLDSWLLLAFLLLMVRHCLPRHPYSSAPA